MSAESPATTYSATIVGGGYLGSTVDIDIRPPFTPSEEFLEYCGEEYGVRLQHFVTTPNTTRLTAIIQDESLDESSKRAAFEGAAGFVTRVLTTIDVGGNVYTVPND